MTQADGAPRSPRVAVIGCGYWGRNLVRNFHELGALAAVHDIDEAVSRQFSETYRVPAPGLTALLSDPMIDAVVIAVPTERHMEVLLPSLAAGKHVFVEKPLAPALADTEVAVSHARRAGRVLLIGHLLQYHPGFTTLLDLTRRGELGQLRYISSNRLNLGKIRHAGHVFWDFAPHDVSMILALAGSEPEQVVATGGGYLRRSILDVASMQMQFPGGAQAHVLVSWLHPIKEHKLVVVGEKGMAVFDDTAAWDRKLTLYPHRINWVEGLPEPVRAEAVPVPLTPAEPLKLECSHFLDCVAGRARPLTDGAEALRVARVLQAVEQSAIAIRPADFAQSLDAAYSANATRS